MNRISLFTAFLINIYSHAASGFTATANIPHTLSKTKLHNCKNNGADDISISRRTSISIGLASIVPFLSLNSPAEAAIPTMDDYENTQNGSQLKSTIKLTKAQQQMVQTLSLRQNIENKGSLSALSDKLIQSLNAMDGLVISSDWAAVRSALRAEGQYDGNVLNMVRKNYLGVTDAKLSSGTKGSEKVLKSVLGTGVDGKSYLFCCIGTYFTIYNIHSN